MATAASRKLLIRRAVVVGVLAILIAAVVAGYKRFYVPPEQKELLWYYRDVFPRIHAQTRSIQSGIAGLIDEGAPSPSGARAILDDNVLPSLAMVLEQARSVRPETLEVRLLHDGYVEALEGMRQDAEAMRDIFAAEGGTPEQKRYDASKHLDALVGRFEKYYDRAEEVWRENGIVVEPRGG